MDHIMLDKINLHFLHRPDHLSVIQTIHLVQINDKKNYQFSLKFKHMSKTKKVKYLSVPSDVHIETKQLDHVFLKYGNEISS